MKVIISLIIFLAVFFSTLAQNTKELPLGTWTNEEKEAQFQIFKCGKKLCGKIIWLKEPLLNNKPKVDNKNPEAKLKDRPILGMIFMKDFTYEGGNKWDNGTIYDPKSGKTYSCYMKMLKPDKMEVKGYIGISLVGRSQIWTRVK